MGPSRLKCARVARMGATVSPSFDTMSPWGQWGQRTSRCSRRTDSIGWRGVHISSEFKLVARRVAFHWRVGLYFRRFLRCSTHLAPRAMFDRTVGVLLTTSRIDNDDGYLRVCVVLGSSLLAPGVSA